MVLGMRILITGGSGFIGSHLAQRLLHQGHRVLVVDDFSTGRRHNLRDFADHEGLEIVEGDFAQPTLVRQVCQNIDQVYHLAAAVGVALIAKHPIQTIHRNVYPTQLLLETLRDLHQKGESIPLFLASTSEVYGKNPKERWNEEDDLVFGSTTKPRWSYGASKAIDEFLGLACVRECQMPLVIGRFFNVVGPRQTGAYGMVLPRFVKAALMGQPIVVHDDGLQQRCFAHVDDIVGAVTRLMGTPSAYGRVYNIGSDQPFTILHLAERVRALVNPKVAIEHQTYAEAYDSDFEDIRRRVPDLTRLRSTIPYEAKCDLDAMICDVRDWMQAHRGEEGVDGDV